MDSTSDTLFTSPHLDEEIRDYFFVVGVGLIFLILGIVGITSNHKQYNEYSSSSDIRWRSYHT